MIVSTSVLINPRPRPASDQELPLACAVRVSSIEGQSALKVNSVKNLTSRVCLALSFGVKFAYVFYHKRVA